MATHAPHVRTKKPLRGRVRRVAPAPKLRYALATHAIDTRLIRRGPPSGERSAPTDLTFRIAAGGVILAAALLGIAMGVAQPSWMLAATLVAGGALVAAVVALSSPQYVPSSG